MLTQHDLSDLARYRNGLLVSFFLPTHRSGPDKQQEDRLQLKNLLSDAAAVGEREGANARQLGPILAPAAALQQDELFWLRQGEGLALFCSSSGMRAHRLAHSVAPFVLLRDRWCLRPALPSISAGGRWMVLALSQNRVRLVECSREDGARELDRGDIPHNLLDAVGYDVEQKSLQFHSVTAPRAGGGTSMFHGHGAGDAKEKAELHRFVQLVDHGVCALLGARPVPLVVAAVDYEASAYRNASKYPHLAGVHLDGNPDLLSARTLRDKTLPIVEPILEAERTAAIAHVAEVAYGERGAKTLPAVLAAARDGRVSHLLAVCERPLWGKVDPELRHVALHEERQPGDDDLLDLAIAMALATGAEVHAVPADALPGGGPVAAALRY